MQDFYRCEEGMLSMAMQVANKACYKLMADMLYDTCIQAIIDYKACIKHMKVGKPVARNIRLTREQYLQVNAQHY